MYKTLLLAVSLFLFLAPSWAQGPLDGYMKEKGVLDVAPSFSFNQAQQFLGGQGEKYDTPYKGQMFSLFAAYGLSKRIELVATAAAVFTPTQSGLQDGGLFLKFRPFYRPIGSLGKIGAIAGIGAAFPLADYNTTATGALGQKAVTLPLRFILQWETPLGLFLNVTGGYHKRLDRLDPAEIALVWQSRPDYMPIQPQDFTTLLLKAGFPARRFYLDGWLEWQHTAGGADYQPNVRDLAQAFRVSYAQAGGTLYYSDSGKNGFFISGGYIFQGKNVSLIRRITVGMVLKFRP